MWIKLLPDGRVTIPKELRTRLNWVPGTRVELIRHGDGLLIRQVGDVDAQVAGGAGTHA